MPSREPLERYTRRDRLSASDLNEAHQRLERLERAQGSASRTLAGIPIDLPDTERWFLIVLDGASDGSARPKYTAWHEVDLDPAGAAVAVANGLTGSVDFPAYSESGYDAPSGTVAYPAVFSLTQAAVCFFGSPATGGGGGGGAIEVKDVSGAHDYTAVTVLLFDQATGFVLSQPSAGQAQVGMQDASASQKGVVNLITQHFAGLKIFDGNAQANASFTAPTFIVTGTFGGNLSNLELITGSGTFTATISGGTGGFGAGFPITRMSLTPQGIGIASQSNFGGGYTYDSACYSVVDNTSTLRTGIYQNQANGDKYAGGLLYEAGTIGFTGTAFFLKVTPGGTGGSMTFSKGFCTGYVAPT